MFLIQHQARPAFRTVFPESLSSYKPRALRNIHKHSLAWAEADIAIKPPTVKARIKFIFIAFSWSAGSAYADVTFEGDRPLQLSGDYYLVYTAGHR
jgi:hypothetical protein